MELHENEYMIEWMNMNDDDAPPKSVLNKHFLCISVFLIQQPPPPHPHSHLKPPDHHHQDHHLHHTQTLNSQGNKYFLAIYWTLVIFNLAHVVGL